MDKVFSRQGLELPKGWTRLRAQIMKRDKYLCVMCLKRGKLKPISPHGMGAVVDHIIPRHKFREGQEEECHHPDNLQSLCVDCNKEKTRADAGVEIKKVCVHGSFIEEGYTCPECLEEAQEKS